MKMKKRFFVDFCELQFKCPATDEDITDEVRDHFGSTTIRGDMNPDTLLGIQIVSPTLCRVMMDCHSNKAEPAIGGMDKWVEVPCPGTGGVAPPIDIEGHGTSSLDLAYYTINHYFGLTLLNYYDQFYQPVWSTLFEGSGIEVAKDLSLDATHNALTTGYFTNTLADSRGGTYTAQGDKDAFLIQHDPSGNEIWTLQISGFGSEEGNGLEVDNTGNIVVTGSFDNQISFDGYGMMSESQNMFLAKFDGTGQFIWAKSGGGLGKDAGISVTTDAQNNIFVAGYYEGTAYFSGHTFSDTGDDTPELFIAKYDKNGELIWAKRAVSNGFEVEKVKVATTLSGGVAVFGEVEGGLVFEDGTTIQGSANNKELSLAVYEADGTLLWVNQLGNTPDEIRMGGIDVDDNGYIVINGSFGGSATIGNTTLQSAGGMDIFVAQFTPDGSLLGAKAEGAVQSEFAADITAVKNTNHIAYTGRFYGAPIIEGQQLQAGNDKGSSYVVGFGTSSTKQALVLNTSLKRIYPNPFNDNFLVEISAARKEAIVIHLYDVQGKLILQKNFDLAKGYNALNIDANSAGNGLYLLEVIYDDGTSVTKKLNRIGK